MKYEKDFKEFLELLTKNKVKYCVVGAFAVGIHGTPRYTKDLDLLVEPTKENGKKVIKTLNDFGFHELARQIDLSDFEKAGNVIQLGQEPVRIDLVMSIDGCSFSEVWRNRKKTKYGHIKVYYIGFNELIKNKQASGRSIDLIDVKNLKKSSKKK